MGFLAYPVRQRMLAWVLVLLAAAPAGAAVPAAATAAAEAGFRGLPLMQRYTAEDYLAAPLHFAVQADTDGTLYVGNVEGVLHFDGSQWTRLELPGRQLVRALARGPDGRVYVGSYDQFGVIERSPGGERSYRDLRQAFGLQGAAANVGDVWVVLSTPAGVYFRTSSALFFLGNDGSTRQWPVPPEARGFHAVGDVLYTRLEGTGLARFENGRLLPVPGAAAFAQRPLFALFERSDGLLLVADDGFWLSDPSGIQRLPGDAGRIFAASPPYVGRRLADGSLALGTFTGEILHFDAGLQFLASYPIGSFTVLSLGTDREGGLWAATEGDLVRLSLPSPWSAFTAGDGLRGAVSDCVWHDDTLWVSTSLGVARARRDGLGRTRFEEVVRTELEAYDLEADPAGLLIAERDGVLWLPRGADAAQRVAEMVTAYVLLRSPFDPDTVFVHGDEAILRLGRGAGGWRVRASWPLEGVSATTLEQTAPDTLWLGDGRGAPLRWTLSADGDRVVERRRFGAEDGLELDPLFGSTLLRLDGGLFVASGQRLFAWGGQRFEPASGAPFDRFERPMELSISETPVGTFAWSSRDLLLRRAGSRSWEPVLLGSRLARGFTNVHADADGRVRVITWNALLQYDPGVPEPAQPALAVRARAIELTPPRGEPQRLPLQAPGPRALAPDSQLRFTFQLPTMEPGAQVRWRILGMAEEWSAWTPVADASLTVRSLDGGEYRLEAEGRTPGGRPVEPLHYAFAATPHWYRTPAAWVAGVLLLLALVVLVSQLIARLRYRQIAAVNRRLEQKIAERTRELEDANRRLEELATEDSLTGVANRRALEHALAREWERGGELGLPLAVVMIDVDHFKQFNDRHGHLEGDQRLRWVADRLGTQVRPVRELLARFGGEEFALILPGHGVDEALDRAERLRRLFDTADSELTISLGVAVEVPTSGRAPAELLRRADMALYQAKRNGRNRVELARR
jgi:diguanylate cyclase (GGDEF)-like protein